MQPFVILGAVALVPVLLAHTMLLVFWAFRLKNAGRYGLRSLCVFGGFSGGTVVSLLTAWNLSGYQELHSSGQTVIASGSFAPSAYLAILIAGGIGAAWGVLAALAFHGLSQLANRATGSKS